VIGRLRTLDRKLVRDVIHLRGQVIAISVVVLCGVATVVSMRSAYQSLAASQAGYYTQYGFADVFAHVKRAPEALRSRIAAIPGVSAVETRVVAEVTLDVPGLAEPATGRLLSVPSRHLPILNDLYLRSGSWVEPGRNEEVMVSEAFATANRLRVGDMFGAVINGRWERLRIVGIALSPEYIYEIGSGSLFPDNRRFGVVWMSRDALEAAFDMKSAFNDVSLRLESGANEAEVIGRLDRLLERYGGLGAYGRKDQTSNAFISDEIKQARVSGTVIPAVFLGIAAFLLNIVLSRLVTTQRDQVAVLKAFGYSNQTIGLHYLKLALAALLLGSVAGLGFGVWIASALDDMYAHYYRFPVFASRLDATAFIVAVSISALAAAIGATTAIWRAVSIPPAEAMRPEGPAEFRPGILERLHLQRRLALAARIIVRNLERHPAKTGLSALGIGLAVATLLVGRFFVDAMRFMADAQFGYAQRADVSVVFTQPRSAGVTEELARLPGVVRVEPYRAVPVRLRFGHRERRVAILGLEADGQLRQLVDRSLRIVPVPPDGIVLTTKLGEVLGLAPGDNVTVEILEGSRGVRRVPVAGLVDEMIGMSAYMDAGRLHRLIREEPAVSGAFLAVDPQAIDRLYADLKLRPAVAGVASRDAAMASFESTIQQSFYITMSFLIGFAAAIAFAMVYNVARIALSERGRELASLRVLGFTRGEVATMLLGEQAVLLSVAIPLGLALGYGIILRLASLYQWELFRIPVVISPYTYAYAIVVVLLAGAGSALIIRRRLDRLDLVQVLKTRE
jgi:putative ABC transport system permease protein